MLVLVEMRVVIIWLITAHIFTAKTLAMENNTIGMKSLTVTVIIMGLLSTRILSGGLLRSLCQVVISDLVSSLDSKVEIQQITCY